MLLSFTHYVFGVTFSGIEVYIEGLKSNCCLLVVNVSAGAGPYQGSRFLGL